MVIRGHVARRMRGVAFVVVALSIVLAGCKMEGPPSADLVVGMRGGFLAVVNCGAPMAGPMKVYIGEQRAGGFENFFVAERSGSWATGAAVTTDPTEWDEVDTAIRPLLEPQMPFSVYPQAESGSGIAYFVVPESGIPENSWLHPSGAVSREACAVAE